MTQERRKARNIMAQQYANMPNRETIQAEAELERTRQATLQLIDSAVIQRAQFAGMVLGNPELKRQLSNEDMERLMKSAVEFTDTLLQQGTELMRQRDDITTEASLQDFDEEPPLA